MYLGTIYIDTKFRPDQTSNMAVSPGGHLGKSKVQFLLNFWQDHVQIIDT
jgi:hypothetical protein